MDDKKLKITHTEQHKWKVDDIEDRYENVVKKLAESYKFSDFKPLFENKPETERIVYEFGNVTVHINYPEKTEKNKKEDLRDYVNKELVIIFRRITDGNNDRAKYYRRGSDYEFSEEPWEAFRSKVENEVSKSLGMEVVQGSDYYQIRYDSIKKHWELFSKSYRDNVFREDVPRSHNKSKKPVVSDALYLSELRQTYRERLISDLVEAARDWIKKKQTCKETQQLVFEEKRILLEIDGKQTDADFSSFVKETYPPKKTTGCKEPGQSIKPQTSTPVAQNEGKPRIPDVVSRVESIKPDDSGDSVEHQNSGLEEVKSSSQDVGSNHDATDTVEDQQHINTGINSTQAKTYLRDKYTVQIKPGSDDRFIVTVNWNEGGSGQGKDGWISESIEGEMCLSDMYRKLLETFALNDDSQLLLEMFGKTITCQLDLKFQCSGEKGIWKPKAIYTSNKQHYEVRNKKLEEETQKLRDRETALASKEKEYKLLAQIKPEILRNLGVDNENQILAKIAELTRDSKRDKELIAKLSSTLNKLGHTPDDADQKLELIKGLYGDIKSLNEMSVDDFGKELHRTKESYQMLAKLNKLKDFNQETLCEFGALFGDISSEVKSRVEKLGQYIRDVDEYLVIGDAVRARLADPEQRRKSISKLDMMNKELKHYKLRIFYPQLGDPVDPARHKIVGYDNSGLRGNISRVERWGLAEIDEEGKDVSVIYKPEVIISK